jgi:chromosome segregation protein
LTDFVTAPAALRRRLAQIGLVARADGPGLRGALLPGQRLVSREGDLWRWDGFTAAAEAPSPAARRLAEKNRLAEVEAEAVVARAEAERLKQQLEAVQAGIREAAAAEGAALDTARSARINLDRQRQALAAAEKRAADVEARRSVLIEACNRVTTSEAEATARAKEATAAAAKLGAAAKLESALHSLRASVAERRGAAAEARGGLNNLQRDAELRLKRRAAIAADCSAWSERAARADAARDDMATRLAAAKAERQALAEAPDTFAQRRRALTAEIETGEARRKEAADALAQGEATLAAADREARQALDAMAAAREARAGSQARLDAARNKLGEVVRAIDETQATDPSGLYAQAGVAPGASLPSQPEVEERLSRSRAERERLGAVNLRAEEELAEVEEKHAGLTAEHEDLSEAIRRLRQAIGNLNREGRERLLAAFDTVNGHFQRLFTTLFGGGTAELTLVDADDPLEAGLEILARPPGKKPQVMTLLSGGEQALTAIALIFAVFLTNPSPICVLDEVDAPLDDANVERYCDLLVDMVRNSETRFVVITHNPITMARMDRLFGVTMAERGVSQLVSVDLATAERFQEAV